jgi:hypothetical protein
MLRCVSCSAASWACCVLISTPLPRPGQHWHAHRCMCQCWNHAASDVWSNNRQCCSAACHIFRPTIQVG